MVFSENHLIHHPVNLTEAQRYLETYPNSTVSCSLYEILFPEFPIDENSIIIDLKDIDEFNFFVEDHGHWFIGSTLPKDELAEICLERIPELASLLLNPINPVSETVLDWCLRHTTFLHIANVEETIAVELSTAIEHSQPNAIPCMLTIVKY